MLSSSNPGRKDGGENMKFESGPIKHFGKVGTLWLNSIGKEETAGKWHPNLIGRGFN
jgi:hypothetical protein